MFLISIKKKTKGCGGKVALESCCFLASECKEYRPRCNKLWCNLQGSISAHCWQMSAVHQAYANLPLSVTAELHHHFCHLLTACC